MTPAVKALLLANAGMFGLLVGLRLASPDAASFVLLTLGLNPRDVLEGWQWWQPVTYMFLHAGIFHVLFNMLALWMFGVELERLWGTRFFARYYAITGIGAGLTMIVLSLLPIALGARM